MNWVKQNMSRKAEKLLKGLIKLVGGGIAIGSAYLAYLFSTVTDIAFPIFAALMVFFLAMMIIGSLIVLFY